MLLYRICRCTYANDLTGIGARLYGGRWNSEGQAAVYTASSRSLALLEVLVHIPPTNIPDDYCIMVIEAPDSIEIVDPTELPSNWREFPESNDLKQFGNRFLSANKFLLLQVPSVIVEEEYNYLINPLHQLAGQVKVIEKKPFAFDVRLL